MHNPQTVEHTGIIQSITKGHIKVTIFAQSACASCHAKGACGVSDTQDKTIDIYTSEEGFTVGEDVNVKMEQKLGFRALFLGYILPFLIVITMLITAYSITKSEGIAGLLSIGILIPYYWVLYIKRNEIQKTFSFNIEKLDK